MLRITKETDIMWSWKLPAEFYTGFQKVAEDTDGVTWPNYKTTKQAKA